MIYRIAIQEGAHNKSSLYVLETNKNNRQQTVQTTVNRQQKNSSAHDEETAYYSYMNPEPDFRAGPGDSYDAA
jgi:isoaspartyl peptidase/L-asparaginase-like protein (Ntn-hydrolase superfamily)